MSNRKVAEIVMGTLEAVGVRYCYGIVGNALNHVTGVIHRNQVQWVHVRREEVAALVAGTEFHISGRPAAYAGSCGPGNLHFISSVHEAQRNRTPMVLIASQIVTLQLGMEFLQEIGFKAIYASCSVFYEQMYSPEQARWMVALACQTALNRRGVAVVTLPADISRTTVKDNLPFSVYLPQPVLRPNSAELQDIACPLAHDKKIGIYTGSGCQDARDLPVALADRLKVPIAYASRIKDSIEYDNPFSMGMTGMLGIESGFHIMTECGILLLLGVNFARAQFYPQKAILIQVDRDGSHLGRHHLVDLGVVDGVIPTSETLLPLLEVHEKRSFLDECLEHRERPLRALEEEEQAGKGKLTHPQYLVNLLDQHVSEDVLFTADGGPATAWLLHHIHSNGKHRTLTSLVHDTMASAVSQALGLEKAYPGRQVISISGDGDLAMLFDDLLMAIQEKLPTKVMVLNNAPLSFVRLEQKAGGLLDSYTDLFNPDFVRFAEMIGFHGRKVTHSKDLEAAVQEFLARSGSALLDVHISPAELVMPPKIEFGRVADAALYAAKTMLSECFEDIETLLVNNPLK